MTETKHPRYHFFVDTKPYETDKESLTGLEIKTIAAVPGNYQLFREEKGEKPDEAISDGQGVKLSRDEHKNHFFAVPPATFGLRHT